jgi:hypothetical protein
MLLSIRPEQTAILEGEQASLFWHRVLAFLRDQFTSFQAMSDQQIRQLIEPIMEKAKTYGLVAEQQVIGYILVALYLGSDFDVVFPEAASVLSDANLSGDDKLVQLQAFIF